MKRKSTHRGFIREVSKDDTRFSAVLDEALYTGAFTAEKMQRWNDEGRTRNEYMKCLLSLIEDGTISTANSPDLKRLIEICHQSQTIRRNLAIPDLWRAVFSRTLLPLDEPVYVEPMGHQGRCNYTYRISGGSYTYVARYHDPLGRDFLQRHEPRLAAHIYCVAEKLIGICLGRDNVVSTLFPTCEPGDLDPDRLMDEDSGKFPEIVADRILIQSDYSKDYFVLTDYESQYPELTVEKVLELYVHLLAQLHAHSRCLYSRAQNPAASDQLAQTFRHYRDLLRFDTPMEYGQWLDGENWISRRVLRGLSKGRNTTHIWASLLNRLGYSPSELIEWCRALWQSSTQAMADSGSLVHFDHNPRNCFINKQTRDRTKLFDFDYVAIIDPAYEIGLIVNSFVRLVLQKEGWDSAKLILEIIEMLFKLYEHHYVSVATGLSNCFTAFSAVDLQHLISRAKAFAGLTIAVTLDENDQYSPDLTSDKSKVLSERQKSILLTCCESLLRQGPRFDHSSGRRG